MTLLRPAGREKHAEGARCPGYGRAGLTALPVANEKIKKEWI